MVSISPSLSHPFLPGPPWTSVWNMLGLLFIVSPDISFLFSPCCSHHVAFQVNVCNSLFQFPNYFFSCVHLGCFLHVTQIAVTIFLISANAFSANVLLQKHLAVFDRTSTPSHLFRHLSFKKIQYMHF